MRRIATIAAAFGIGAAAALLFYLVPASTGPAATIRPVWTETKWPFPMDQWGEGKAFRCKAADCGAELNLYIRPKIGFCSSTTGVADDSELDRLSDFDFMNGATVASGEGHAIDVDWMKGRLRAYAIPNPARSRTTAISIAYNNDSDALVATVVVNDAQPAAVEPLVIAFLNGDVMRRWVATTLGL
jgi:hypothetical protein